MTTPPPYDPSAHSPHPTGRLGAVGTVDAADRSMAMIAHLSTIASWLVSVGWLSFVGPLVVWFLYKDKSAFVRQAAAGSFNFNVSMWLVNLVGWICIFTVIGIFVGVPLIVISAVAQLVCHIIAAVRANKGELYDYPFQLRILS